MGIVGHKREAARFAALDKAQAIIEFDLDGVVVAANENFLKTVGYRLDEIVGRHHGMFVDPAYRESDDYAAFWAGLRRGEAKAAQFRRLAKGGREVWIEASYNPILSAAGTPVGVVKFATDITCRKQEDADRAGQIAAIRKSQAVISFTLDGVILDANENFLSVVGYRFDEIQGRHHSMFVDAAEREGAAYAAFWDALRRGDYQAAQYRRIGKDGREIWIQASYNPIFDASGQPYKIVKFATDVTEQRRLLTDLRRMIDHDFGKIDLAVTTSVGRSRTAIEAASTVGENVDGVAAAVEELAASIASIADGMGRSKNATDEASGQATAVDGLTGKLSEAASQMGGIVNVIQSIASQINLLALNATIESARAGEAGRGFAVVAQEVKSLADQASKATDLIAVQITGVQSISSGVVGALGAILGSVEVMREEIFATSGALEQQRMAVRDVSGTMHAAAQAVKDISGSVADISEAVQQVSEAAARTRSAATALAG
ncbi:MAG: chemotaxis protein [Ancylobacter novellus]|uniref:Chemotaxis protein n=1 Tax=Ancylobacter novellus TaxID=921 RepID=A0A2W5ME78_ANCNO|nr:MAG: chemotaxis protein [Ancylobacter novellus]